MLTKLFFRKHIVYTPLYTDLSFFFPTGYIKAQAATLFSLGLSTKRMKAIDKLGFGNIGKIFLEYENAFWGNDDDSVMSVCTSQAQWLKHLHLFTVMRPKDKYDKQLVMFYYIILMFTGFSF